MGLSARAAESTSEEPRRPDAFGRLEMVKGLNLTDAQKAKLEELRKEYGPKMREAWTKREGVLTEDQKKAREAAIKSAREAGKRGLEVMQAARSAVKLTDEQRKKMRDMAKEAEPLGKEMLEKMMGVLTAEQKELVKKAFEERRAKPAEKK